MRHSLPITRNHPTRGPEQVADITFGDVVDFYLAEGHQLVLRLVTTKEGEVVGLDLTPYPEHYEMRQD